MDCCRPNFAISRASRTSLKAAIADVAKGDPFATRYNLACFPLGRHPTAMIKLFFLALASTAEVSAAAPPCVPIASDHLAPTSSAFEDHGALRKAIGEPMPQAPTMVMMYGRGGHLSTIEYSIVLARGAGSVWHGTAVGRRQIWIKDAPYTPMKRIEWVLDEDQAHQLDDALSRRCPLDRAVASNANDRAPSLGYIAERIDVIQQGQPPVTYHASEGDGRVALLIRPPQ